MELLCVFVFTIISLTNCTPYGYGVKNGALSRAEAGAVAGASAGGLGVAPLPAPGVSYSGGFSKSSSSSFAASSASSSSFSYSGSGALSGSNGFPAGSNCQSGNCHNAEIAPHTPSNGGLTGYGQSQTNSNAAALAGASAIAGAQNGNGKQPCSGDCPGKSPECDGSNCNAGAVECKSGLCNPHKQIPAVPEVYESDDIPVNVGSPTKTNTLNNPAYGNFNDKPGNSGKGTPCTSGNCGPNTSNVKYPATHCGSAGCNGDTTHTTYEETQTNQKPYKPSSVLSTPKETPQFEPACSSPNCGTSNVEPTDNGIPSSNASPSFIPLQDKCSSGNCGSNYGTSTSNPGTPPSSYNVPIHGPYIPTINPTEKDSGCANGNCGNNKESPTLNVYPPTNQGPTQGHPPSSYNVPIHGPQISAGKGPSCTSGSCDSSIAASSQSTSNGNSISSSNYLGSNTFDTPNKNAPNGGGCNTPGCNNPAINFPKHTPTCTSGNCGSNYNNPVPTSSHSSVEHNGYPQNGSPVNLKPGTSNCGQGGCTGNSFHAPKPVPSYNTPQISPSVPTSGCSSGDCHSVSTPSNIHEGHKAKLPIYSGGFGGPSGILKPNEYSAPNPQHNFANHASPPASNHHDYTAGSQTSSAGYIPQHPSGSFNLPHSDTPKSPIEGFNGNPHPETHLHPNVNQIGSSSNAAASATAAANAVSFSGSFGGPPGLLKPYDGGKTSDLPKSGLISPTANNNLPHSSYQNYGNPSAYGKSLNVAGSQTSSGSGAFNGDHSHTNVYDGGNHGSSCKKCSSGGGYGGNGAFGVSGSFANAGALGGADGLANGGAAAKSAAGALSGANSYGLAGSFASSSASAHAGAATKGGYGRR